MPSSSWVSAMKPPPGSLPDSPSRLSVLLWGFLVWKSPMHPVWTAVTTQVTVIGLGLSTQASPLEVHSVQMRTTRPGCFPSWPLLVLNLHSPAVPPPGPPPGPGPTQHSLQTLLLGQAEVAAVQSSAQVTLLPPLLPLKQQGGASPLNPPPVPVQVSLVLFFLEPLEGKEAAHHCLSPEPKSPRGLSRGPGFSFYRWGNQGSEEGQVGDQCHAGSQRRPPACPHSTWPAVLPHQEVLAVLLLLKTQKGLNSYHSLHSRLPGSQVQAGPRVSLLRSSGGSLARSAVRCHLQEPWPAVPQLNADHLGSFQNMHTP